MNPKNPFKRTNKPSNSNRKSWTNERTLTIIKHSQVSGGLASSPVLSCLVLSCLVLPPFRILIKTFLYFSYNCYWKTRRNSKLTERPAQHHHHHHHYSQQQLIEDYIIWREKLSSLIPTKYYMGDSLYFPAPFFLSPVLLHNLRQQPTSFNRHAKVLCKT